MANTLPVSFSRSGSKNDAQNPPDLMIEHQSRPDQSEPNDSPTLNEGGDSGTKGTGSAGRD